MWPVHQPEDWISSQYTPVRHYYDDLLPAYNLTMLEDQIDGFYYAGSDYWNSIAEQIESGGAGGVTGTGSRAVPAVQDPNSTTTTDSVRTALDDVHHSRMLPGGVGAKSKTLPEGSNLRPTSKHQRSLSESKTTDVISLLGGATTTPGTGPGTGLYPTPYQHRIRYNSCTDSNTSGVSSCESVTGRTAAAAAAAAANISEYQQFPLSPIPSMSNLLESDELIRRHQLATSLLPSALSPMAMKGYAQLRSLRAHSRPVFSESAAEFYKIVDAPEVQLRKHDWTHPHRRLKVRSLDRQPMLSEVYRWV